MHEVNFVKVIRIKSGYTKKQMADVFGIPLIDYLEMEMNNPDELRIRDCKILLTYFKMNPLEILILLDPQSDPR
jgi:DNA-binding XRE family transcriptional regulator